MSRKRRKVGDVTLEFEGEGSILAFSDVLCLASPVFDGMLASEMGEASLRRVKITNSTKAEFTEFYELLMPGHWSPSKLTEENVDSLLVLSDYYQVDFLRQGCEEFLTKLPATVPRLLQAHAHNLKAQYEHCIRELAAGDPQKDLKMLQVACPSPSTDLALALHGNLVAAQDAFVKLLTKFEEDFKEDRGKDREHQITILRMLDTMMLQPRCRERDVRVRFALNQLVEMKQRAASS